MDEGRMTNEELLDYIDKLAGEQRRATFRKAIELVLAMDPPCRCMVETGTYRGIGADGESTMIIGTVAGHLAANAWSVDISSEHCQRSLRHTADLVCIHVIEQDSVSFLRDFCGEIEFLYLDSYDYEEADPLPAQIHQANEVMAALRKLSDRAVVLLDDAACFDEGKTKLSSPILEKLGFRRIADAYQRLYVR